MVRIRAPSAESPRDAQRHAHAALRQRALERVLGNIHRRRERHDSPAWQHDLGIGASGADAKVGSLDRHNGADRKCAIQDLGLFVARDDRIKTGHTHSHKPTRGRTSETREPMCTSGGAAVIVARRWQMDESGWYLRHEVHDLYSYGYSYGLYSSGLYSDGLYSYGWYLRYEVHRPL